MGQEDVEADGVDLTVCAAITGMKSKVWVQLSTFGPEWKGRGFRQDEILHERV